jgi:diguanylate cyclase (GGDEF)-like protein
MSARVLVIDTNPSEAAQIREWLAPCRVEVEGDPEAGWERLSAEPFDAVLLEDGRLETRRVLRRLEQGHLGCFLIILGDRPTPERALAAVTGGAFAYLLRPLKAPKVRSALRRGLNNRQKLLEIVALAEELRRANRQLGQQRDRLEREKRQLAAKGRQLNLLNELGGAASSTLEPERIVAAVSQRLCRELPLAAWAALFAPPGAEVATLFLPGPMTPVAAGELGRQLQARLIRAGGRVQAVTVYPIGRRCLGPRQAARLAGEPGLVLPLLAGGHPIGLYKLLPQGELGADLVGVAESAANIIALGLRNAGELLAARKLADYDALTRLANRRAFERQLRHEFGRWRRYRHPLTLIMADIDHFKDINDRYGHQTGDRVLRQVARALCAAVRECDFVARYGGEEFSVILPQTELAASLNLARRLKQVVESHPLVVKSAPLSLTVSLGVADTAAPQAEEPLDLVRLADHALYLSKSAGRNRISTWRDIQGPEGGLSSAPRPGSAPEPAGRQPLEVR